MCHFPTDYFHGVRLGFDVPFVGVRVRVGVLVREGEGDETRMVGVLVRDGDGNVPDGDGVPAGGVGVPDPMCGAVNDKRRNLDITCHLLSRCVADRTKTWYAVYTNFMETVPAPPTDLEQPPHTSGKTVLLGLVACVGIVGLSFFVLRGKPGSPLLPVPIRPTATPAAFLTVSGMLRTSGLSPEEQSRLGLTNVSYQVTDLRKADEALQGYFLHSATANLDALLGKCVTIEGTIPDPWKTADLTPTYRRSVLQVQTIKDAGYAFCSKPVVPISPGASESAVPLQGIVQRLRRPAPDISYDYTLHLTEQPDPGLLNTSSETSVPVGDIALLPRTMEMVQFLEDHLEGEVIVTGYVRWGYAESQYLELTGGALSEKEQVKKVITQLEQYVQKRPKSIDTRTSDGILALFTEPKTTYENTLLNHIRGLDTPERQSRLFSTPASDYRLVSWKIVKDPATNADMITKTETQYTVIVEEVRQSADPVLGGYSNLKPVRFIVELEKQYPLRGWEIDRYYPEGVFPASETDTLKYRGLGF